MIEAKTSPSSPAGAQPKRAAIYLRVSTSKRSPGVNGPEYDQDPAVQEKPLRTLIAQRGWKLAHVYQDRASGASEHRPGLSEMLKDARKGLIDVIVVWRFDRFARSVKQLIFALEEFQSLRVDFVSHQESLDTSTPLGKVLFTVIAAMAELERSAIRERVLAGLEYAREHGTKSGRPAGRPRVIFRRDQVVQLRRDGLSWRQIARRMGVGVTTVRRAYGELAAKLVCRNPIEIAS